MKFESAVYDSSFGTVKQLKPSVKPEIVFSGRSNVGKSSLLNKILNRKNLARVSATPGKTITVNFFSLDTVMFVDLPGYGYAKRSASEQKRWSDLVEGYFNSNRNILTVAQLIDIRHKPSADDIMMLKFLVEMELPFFIVFTKSDKLNKTERANQEKMFSEVLDFVPKDVKKIAFSALKGEGVEEIKSYLRELEK